jgi:hypothetical protein
MPPLDAVTPAHRANDAGRQENAMLGSSQISDTATPHAFQLLSPAAQAAIADLQCEFIAECLRIAAVKASHAADNILLADDLNAERDIRIAIENIREAARSFREWQARDARHG